MPGEFNHTLLFCMLKCSVSHVLLTKEDYVENPSCGQTCRCLKVRLAQQIVFCCVPVVNDNVNCFQETRRWIETIG